MAIKMSFGGSIKQIYAILGPRFREATAYPVMALMWDRP